MNTDPQGAHANRASVPINERTQMEAKLSPVAELLQRFGLDNRLYTTKETAELLGVQENTLVIWRVNKRYPKLRHVKLGSRYVRYAAETIAEIMRDGLE
jgi:predicted DNA-binding transcriptional regulator AlpA